MSAEVLDKDYNRFFLSINVYGMVEDRWIVHGLIICIMMTERKFQFWNLKSFFLFAFFYISIIHKSNHDFQNILLLFGIRAQHENDVGGVLK